MATLAPEDRIPAQDPPAAGPAMPAGPVKPTSAQPASAQSAPMSPAGKPRHRIDARAGLFCLLHLTGLAATTLLITWGLFAALFLALGGFSLDGLMHHLGNLTTRYLSADAARRASFREIVAVGHILIFAGVLLCRRHAILPPAPIEGNQRHA
jgi:hypothetical protein